MEVAYALVDALPGTVDSEVRTANPDEVVFSQLVRITEVAQVRDAVPAFVASTRAQIRLEVSADEPLYRISTEQNGSMRAYCSLRTSTLERDAPLLPAAIRLCLSDGDNDGAFEQLWTMRLSPRGRREGDRWILDPSPLFSGGLLRDGGALAAPTPYTVLATHDIAPTPLEITYDRSPLGVGFRLTTRRDETRIRLRSQDFDGLSTQLPRTIDVLGAQIELISEDANAIRYRVLRGFPEDAPLRIADLPTPATAR